eukprot:CAMPEP_0119023568 /NCGR_PEP_ID=MMETSP1176-20130426/30179_1 /TAXON_ID=265551 /ORGANISM="Synedropsis recta cf, Strain CCMP1620" /LENGTH=73 /DNA_ID=CAMNT_0006978663 /DNA_START=303 /DNA_END=524 /DNA_ORIENTATION=-
MPKMKIISRIISEVDDDDKLSSSTRRKATMNLWLTLAKSRDSLDFSWVQVVEALPRVLEVVNSVETNLRESPP